MELLISQENSTVSGILKVSQCIGDRQCSINQRSVRGQCCLVSRQHHNSQHYLEGLFVLGKKPPVESQTAGYFDQGYHFHYFLPSDDCTVEEEMVVKKDEMIAIEGYCVRTLSHLDILRTQLTFIREPTLSPKTYYQDLGIFPRFKHEIYQLGGPRLWAFLTIHPMKALWVVVENLSSSTSWRLPTRFNDRWENVAGSRLMCWMKGDKSCRTKDSGELKSVYCMESKLMVCFLLE